MHGASQITKGSEIRDLGKSRFWSASGAHTALESADRGLVGGFRYWCTRLVLLMEALAHCSNHSENIINQKISNFYIETVNKKN